MHEPTSSRQAESPPTSPRTMLKCPSCPTTSPHHKRIARQVPSLKIQLVALGYRSNRRNLVSPWHRPLAPDRQDMLRNSYLEAKPPYHTVPPHANGHCSGTRTSLSLDKQKTEHLVKQAQRESRRRCAEYARQSRHDLRATFCGMGGSARVGGGAGGGPSVSCGMLLRLRRAFSVICILRCGLLA